MEQVLAWGRDNAELVELICAVGMVCFVSVYPILLFARPKKIPGTGVGIMVKRAEWEHSDRSRRMAERQSVIDMFEDGLLRLFADGKLSATGYSNWHDRFARWINVVDLQNSKVTDLKQVKDMLKKRRNSGTYYGIYARMPNPGPKPGERTEAQQAKDELHALLLSLHK